MTKQIILLTSVLAGLFIAQSVSQNPDEMGNYLEGDIVGGAFPPSANIVQSRSGLLNTRFRWPGNTIPYAFESNYPEDLQSLFRDAIAQISSRTCLRFTARTTESDYIRLISGNGCYSFIGRIRGAQNVSLPRECDILGVFIHEIIHALGFFHEQSRPDRDDYVQIHLQNVRSGFEGNFAKESSRSVGTFGVPYDYGSVMHYSDRAFARGWRRTIVPRQANVEIGQRRGMSEGDAQKINNMYCN